MKDLHQGLKCGIEIHQQLEGKKLFCSCPTHLRDDLPNFTVRRKLRASAGESGEIDVAARQEQLRDKIFIYEGYNDTNCLVELDEEPPHNINQEAFYTSLQLSKMVDADVSPIIQVMRKTVVDGSNTSGFQRTALVARNGTIKTSEGEVRIANISLEEDSSKIIAETSTTKTYRLDRLGIPLIEIGTEPDLKTPQQVQETAKKIGMLLRSLPGIKRGLGTIRQDVNISIRGGARIEIKGAQDLKMIPTLVELEIKRQSELLKIKEELYGHRLDKLEIIDLSILLKDSQSSIIMKTLQNKGKIMGFRLHNFAGLIGRELQPGYRVGSEFSGRAKAKAGIGGIFHSDELPNYGITEAEVRTIRKKMGCEAKDGFVLVAAEENKARIALEAVYERVEELSKGVPKEVRKALDDGKTAFMRPLSGAARMYPETDVPLITASLDNVEIPETLEEKIKRYQEKLGLAGDLAVLIAKSDKAMLFEELVVSYSKMKPAFIAETLTSTPLEIRRKYQLDTEPLEKDNFKAFKNMFAYLHEGKIHKDIVIDVLIEMIKGSFDLKKYESLSTEEIHKEIKKIVEENKGAPFGAVMGLCMKRLAGKASGQVISEELKKLLK